MNNGQSLVSSNWDRAYRNGKYDKEGPIPFVKDIVNCLEKEKLTEDRGFYPGCGNGRNLIPLLAANLNIEALDISDIAVKQLKARSRNVKASVGDFSSLTKIEAYDYLLSIQLFQHVDKHGPQPLFDKTVQLLKSGGLFFLRVNSVHTQITQEHEYRDTVSSGGFTIQYKSGHKDGQYIHFYSAEEIHALTMGAFDVVMPLREECIPRDDGSYWVRWETILKKR